MATYHCGGQSYYCMNCHDNVGPKGKKCKNKKQCPLKVDHPRDKGIAFGIGCGMCKEVKFKSLAE